jgi:hypothetical protein
MGVAPPGRSQLWDEHTVREGDLIAIAVLPGTECNHSLERYNATERNPAQFTTNQHDNNISHQYLIIIIIIITIIISRPGCTCLQ